MLAWGGGGATDIPELGEHRYQTVAAIRAQVAALRAVRQKDNAMVRGERIQQNKAYSMRLRELYSLCSLQHRLREVTLRQAFTALRALTLPSPRLPPLRPPPVPTSTELPPIPQRPTVDTELARAIVDSAPSARDAARLLAILRAAGNTVVAESNGEELFSGEGLLMPLLDKRTTLGTEGTGCGEAAKTVHTSGSGEMRLWEVEQEKWHVSGMGLHVSIAVRAHPKAARSLPRTAPSRA